MPADTTKQKLLAMHDARPRQTLNTYLVGDVVLVILNKTLDERCLTKHALGSLPVRFFLQVFRQNTAGTWQIWRNMQGRRDACRC